MLGAAEIRRRAKRLDRLGRAAARRSGELSRRSIARGKRAGATGELSATDRWVLQQVDYQLSRRPSGRVALLNGDTGKLIGLVELSYPRATVAAPEPSADAEPSADPDPTAAPTLHAQLADAGPFDIIVDLGGGGADQAALFRSVFFHLVSGGRFAARLNLRADAPQGLWPLIARLVSVRSGGAVTPRPNKDDTSLAKAVGRTEIVGDRLVVTSRGGALPKLHYAEADFVLERRGPKFGTILHQRDAESYLTRATIRDHRAESIVREPALISVPPLALREYADAYCLPRQVAVSNGMLLPDTYRHHLRPRLTNVATIERAPLFADVASDLTEAETLPGTYFALDSEYAGHFGHLMSEQVARLWALPAARSRYPEVRILLSRGRRGIDIYPHELGVLNAAGIDASEVELIYGPVRVERLLAATPMYSMPEYVSPQIAEVWNALGKSAAAAAGPVEPASRLFCARRAPTKTRPSRWCTNHDEVEAAFVDHGFRSIYPEDYPFAEQIAMFRNADVVAGFAGSGMFSLMLCDEPKRAMIVNPETYVPHNECLIAGVAGHELDIFWGVPDFPTNVHSPYTFNFDREGKLLLRALSDL